jgi:hypothetical protein
MSTCVKTISCKVSGGAREPLSIKNIGVFKGHIGHIINKLCKSEVYFLLNKLCILSGSDPAWALSDTKLSSQDLQLARRRAAS